MYYTSFGYRHTATDASASVTFAMRNPTDSAKRIVLRKLIVTVGFDGATGAASRVGYGFSRFTVANPTGGTSPVRCKQKSEAAASIIADAQIKNGAVLTLTSAVYEGNFHEILIPTRNYAVSQILDFGDDEFVLLEGEGICARLALIAVIGLGVSGSVWWNERMK